MLINTEENIDIPPKSLKRNINIKLKRPKYFCMKNGLKVILVENHKIPLVRVVLELESIPLLEGNKAGIQKVFGQMLRSGTKNCSKEELDNIVDYMGISFHTSFSEIFISTLKRHLEKSISIILDIIMNCRFNSSEELEKAIKQIITDIHISEKDPNIILKRVKNIILFGKDHPYGEYETVDSVKKITLRDLKRLYKKYYIPNRFYITFVGDISVKEVKYLCKNYFSKWKKKSYIDRYKNEPKQKKISGIKIHIVNIPSLTQSSICFGKTINLRKNDPLYISAILANGILGEGAYSRLFINLREKKAYTYGACSILKPDRNIGSISTYTQVGNEVTENAIRDIIDEISNFVSKGVSLEELKIKKKETIGQFLLDLEDPARISELFVCEKKDNLPYNFYDTLISKIQSVTLEDVYETCKKFFNPNNGIILIVGKLKEILPSIRKLGYPINQVDQFGVLLKENI
ncbi:M16 family metallopeptidase [Blattabacterium cuenoti]|uniref:M16 family metallopeptidase n=1 Tax=Blattabacterium cuenoti TaxID=1653831 RepID=UPI00163BBEDA|nr:pitrilysin family protein [Blattabacterium cuenoti]